MILKEFFKRLIPQKFETPEKRQAVAPMLDLLEQGQIKAAEEYMARFVLKICSEIENGILDPKQGDAYISYLYITLHDEFSSISFSQNVHDMFGEGMCLHQYGSKHPPNINLIKRLANELLENNIN